MSLYIIKNPNQTALAIGNNGSGFTLVFPDWANIRQAAQGSLISIWTDRTSNVTRLKGLQECINTVGVNAQIRTMSLCSQYMDRNFMGFLAAIGGISPVYRITSSAFSNHRVSKWAAGELSNDPNMGTVGFIDTLKEWMERGSKNDSDFTATGSFTGDLLEVLKNPEKYLLTAMKTYASQNPYVAVAFAAQEFGIAIGEAIEKSLKFENIVKGMELTIEDFKTIEKAVNEFPAGGVTDIRQMTVRRLGIAMRMAEIIQNENQLVPAALIGVMTSIRTATKTYVNSKIVGLLGGALANKLFPGGTSLVNIPTTKEEWLKDFGRAAVNEIQKKVEAVATAKA